MTKTERRLELVAEYRNRFNYYLDDIEALIKDQPTQFKVTDKKSYLKQTIGELLDTLTRFDYWLDDVEFSAVFDGEPWLWPEPTAQEVASRQFDKWGKELYQQSTNEKGN